MHTCTRVIHTTMHDLYTGPSTDSMVNEVIVTVAVSSSVTIAVLSSVVFFVFGCICGSKCNKTRTTGDTVSSGTEVTQPVHHHVQAEGREQDIELNENVAYGPVYHQVCMQT